jgi:hypothetical protein
MFGNTFLKMWYSILQKATIDIQPNFIRQEKLARLLFVSFAIKQLQDVGNRK